MDQVYSSYKLKWIYPISNWHPTRMLSSLPGMPTQDPWNFAGDTGKNSFYGTVEKMKLGPAFSVENSSSKLSGEAVDKSQDPWVH